MHQSLTLVKEQGAIWTWRTRRLLTEQPMIGTMRLSLGGARGSAALCRMKRMTKQWHAILRRAASDVQLSWQSTKVAARKIKSTEHFASIQCGLLHRVDTSVVIIIATL